jgi:hypothetical protein
VKWSGTFELLFVAVVQLAMADLPQSQTVSSVFTASLFTGYQVLALSAVSVDRNEQFREI